MSMFPFPRPRQGSKAFTRRQSILLKDLQYLSARGSKAIRDGDKQAAGDVLGLFERLMVEAIEHHDARKPAGTEQLLPRHGSGVHSREWRELMQMLVDVQEAAALAPTRRLRSDVLNSIHRVVSRLVRGNHPEAARQVAAALGWIWAAIDDAEGTWDAGDMDYFLMRLREASSIGAPRPRDLSEAAANSEVFLFAFATIARTSIDRGHWHSAADVIRTLTEAGDYTGKSLYGQAFDLRRRALGLSLFAWILLKRKPQFDAASEAECTAEIASMFQRAPLWDALRLALDDDFQHSVGTSSWEMDSRSVRGMSSGFIEIDHYIRLAALVVASQSSPDTPPQWASDADADLARSLLEQLDGLSQAPDPRFAGDLPSGPHPWRPELQFIVDQREAQREQALADSPLDTSRIDAFRRAIDQALADDRGISESVSGVQRPSGLEPTFGFNRLEPKFWFAESHVHADPARLAKEFVDGIRRGEDARIVSALFDNTKPVSVSFDELPDAVATWLLRRAKPGGTTLVTNSWRAADIIRAAAGATRQQRVDGPEKLRVGEVEVVLHRLFDARDPFVAAFVSPDGLTVQMGQQEAGGDDPAVCVHGGRIVSTIRPPTEAEMEQLRAGSAAQGEELRRQVVIKVLESFDVVVSDPKRLAVWTLPSPD